MSNITHIIDRSTPSDMVEQMLILRKPSEKIISLGTNLHLPQDVDATQIHTPLSIPSLCARKLAGKIDSSIIHVWSENIISAISKVAETNNHKLVLSLHGLPAGKKLQALPWKAGSLNVTLTLPAQDSINTVKKLGIDPKLARLLPPVIPHDIVTRQAVAKTRELLGIGEKDLILTVPATMVHGAGHKVAIWAHAIVCGLRDNCVLILPGDGALRPYLNSFAKKAGYRHQVAFVGRDFPINKIIAASDISICCFERNVGLGYPAFAMATGSAMITPDFGEIHSICKANRLAAVSPQPSPREFSTELLKLIDLQDEREELCNRAKSFSCNNFDPSVVRDKLNNIYESILQQSIRKTVPHGRLRKIFR